MVETLRLEQKEFVGYLRSINTNNNPFDCKELRVLPEDVYFNNHLTINRNYHKGSLICIKSTDRDHHSLSDCRCESFYELKQKDGELEIRCNWSKSFRLEIKEEVE